MQFFITPSKNRNIVQWWSLMWSGEEQCARWCGGVRAGVVKDSVSDTRENARNLESEPREWVISESRLSDVFDILSYWYV